MGCKRWWLLGGLPPVIVAMLVVELNVIDYRQFRGAIDRAERLTPGECLAMADFCQRARKDREYGPVEAPPPFRVLDPRGVRVTPGGAEVVLHELGPSRITLWVERAGDNQRLRYEVHARPARHGRVLWMRQPALAEAAVWPAALDAAELPAYPLPWWCVWRRWAD